jgi:hypothetical protein
MRQPSNWISAVVTLVCGVVLGFVLTIAHRAVAPLGDWSAPLGLILGLVAASALLVGCRLLWEHRLPTAAAAIGLVATQFVVMLQPGVETFFAADFDVTDGIWTIGPAVVAILVLLWPERPESRPARAA